MRYKVIYYEILLLVILTWSTWLTSPTLAKDCYDYQGHNICIISIQRSAKYYWQYKVDLTINGGKQPQTTYDCRHETKKVKNSNSIGFKSGDVGYLICSFFR